jgi:hypothetical protein
LALLENVMHSLVPSLVYDAKIILGMRSLARVSCLDRVMQAMHENIHASSYLEFKTLSSLHPL